MSTYEISKSSLLSLRAEILRKRQELDKTRAENEVKLRNIKKIAPLDLKNKNVDQRRKFDDDSEEEDLLKRSRAALEAKSVIYDELTKTSRSVSNEEIEHNQRYLVRFDKKYKELKRKKNNSTVPDLPPEDEPDDIDKYPDSEDNMDMNDYPEAQNADEEWVEYVDCLGRTRTCLRKDLEHLKSKDKDLESIVDEKRRNRGDYDGFVKQKSPEPEKIDGKGENEEPAEVTENSDLLSNDMRREMLRKQWEKEEEELRNKSDIHYQDIFFDEARSHGVGYYAFSKDDDVRMKQQDALKKLREETKQQQEKSQQMKMMRERQLAARIRAAKNRKRERLGLPPEEEEEPVVIPPEEPTEKTEIVEVLTEQEKILQELRKKHIRPWDKGKEGVREHYEYSQEEWVDKKRRERATEFAPPSSYSKKPDRGFRSTNRHHLPEEASRSLKFSSKRSTLIENEVDDYEDSLLANYRGLNTKKSGAEIAPPATYDYYGPSSSKQRRSDREDTPSSTISDIEAGLRFLREQVEKKQTSTKHSEDMFTL